MDEEGDKEKVPVLPPGPSSVSPFRDQGVRNAEALLGTPNSHSFRRVTGDPGSSSFLVGFTDHPHFLFHPPLLTPSTRFLPLILQFDGTELRTVTETHSGRKTQDQRNILFTRLPPRIFHESCLGPSVFTSCFSSATTTMVLTPFAGVGPSETRPGKSRGPTSVGPTCCSTRVGGGPKHRP